MPVYLIARVDVTDWERYRNYLAVTPHVIERYGGKAIARSGDPQTLEGPRETRRIVILQFPSIKKARECYYLSDYQDTIKIREGAAVGELVIVEGTSSD